MFANLRKSSMVAIIIILAFILGVAAASYAQEKADYQVKTKEIVEKQKKYTVSVKYPKIHGYENSHSEKAFNTLIKGYMDKRVKEFKNSFSKADAEDEGVIRPWDLTIIYETKYQGSLMYCVIFPGGEYTGGAHPNPEFWSVVFNLKSGKRLKLVDIFKPGSAYLQKISQYCIKELIERKVSDENWVKTGAEAKDENYQDFYLTEKGLVVVFTQYQVAPYASGNVEVVVPPGELKDILNPRIKFPWQ